MKSVVTLGTAVALASILQLSPVSAQTAPAGTGELATVVVTMRDQADLSGVSGSPGRAGPRGVVDTLMEAARTSQAPIRARLADLAAQGAVTRIEPLWVVNAISVTATAGVVRELSGRRDVASIRPDAITVHPAAAVAEPNQVQIQAPPLWDLGHTGQGVVVAALDSGVDVSHPDLAGRWRGGTNSWFDPYGQHPTTPIDLTGHGTATMGVMVGGDAGGTSIGTAPGATWIAARVFDDRGGATLTALHQAFQWVLDPDRDPSTADAPQVVNGSWSLGSGPGCDLSLQADVRALRAAGILPVFAAGNFGPGSSTSVSPANYPESLAVGAVAGTDLVYGASSRGPSSCGGRTSVFPDLVAPGVDIRTTDRYGLYQSASGTSLSAPHVAGAWALLLAAVPWLRMDEYEAALLSSAVDLGPAGPDDDYGRGRLDVQAALQALPPPPPPDFGVVVTPSTASVVAGGATTYTVQVKPANGFAGEVSLSLSGLAAGEATWSFDPPTLPGGGSSLLTVATASSTPAGDHPLTVTGTSGAVSRTAAADLTVTVPVPTLELSTAGNSNPPGVGGAADDADIYRWDGQGYRRSFDATVAGVPAGANVDGYDRISSTAFCLSFGSNVTIVLPGPDLTVQDEDVVCDDAGAWSVLFDGTGHGLTASNQDLDAFSVVGSTLYFSTVGNTNPPGVGGAADDADIYSWDGTSYSRVWDASSGGVAAAANVDGFCRVDATHFYLSFGADTTLPGLGMVQDEDVVLDGNGAWSVYFDGTARGLTSSNLDIDAFDVG